MNGGVSVGQARFRVSVVPARAAYLIRPRSAHGLRRAIQEASTRWAGLTEPIVPVRANGTIDRWWRQVVDVANVDGLVNVDVTHQAAARAATSLKLPLVDIAHIDKIGVTQFTTHPAGINDEAPRTVLTIARSDGDLWECAAAGDLTLAHEKDLEGSGLIVHRPRSGDEIARSQISNTTLLARTTAQFGEQSASDGPWPAPTVVWVTTPNSVNDCLGFWNTRALAPLRFERQPVIILPHRDVKAWLDFDSVLAGLLHRAADIEPDVLVCSWSADENRCREVAKLLGLTRTTAAFKSARSFPPPPPRQPPFTFEYGDPRQFSVFGRDYGTFGDALAQIYPHSTQLSLASPVKFNPPYGRALLRISAPALRAYPSVAQVADLFHSGAVWHERSLQIPAFDSDRIDIELKWPTMEESVWVVLRSRTKNAQLSDKGQIGTRLEELALSNLLLDNDVVEVIARLTTPRSKQLLKQLQTLRGDGHPDADLVELASAWGGRFDRRYMSARDLGGRVPAAECLVAGGWAERGLEVRCGRCTLRSFVPLASTQDQPSCPACRAPQGYEVESSSVRVCYRLNSLLDRASDQGVLPHLRTLTVLRATDPLSTFLPGVDVELPNGSKAEVDIFGVYRGQVTAGEVKTSSTEFSVEQVYRDVELTRDLGADCHVMAARDELQLGAIRQARRLTKKFGIGLLLLEAGRLRADDGDTVSADDVSEH
jgi:hypothetical protein